MGSPGAHFGSKLGSTKGLMLVLGDIFIIGRPGSLCYKLKSSGYILNFRVTTYICTFTYSQPTLAKFVVIIHK